MAPGTWLIIGLLALGTFCAVLYVLGFLLMDKLGYEIKGFLGDKTIWGKKD